MPSANELIAHGREVDEIRQIIGADGLIFRDTDDLIEAVREENPDITQFECSVFNGIYVTKDVDQSYLEYGVAAQRRRQGAAGANRSGKSGTA